jgi:hypothetical protein
VYSGEGRRIAAGLGSTGPVDGVLLLEAPEDRVGPKRGGVHGSIQGRLKMFMVVAEGIEEKYNFDLVKIDRPHVGNPRVHGEDLISTIREGCLMAILEIESLFEEKKLGMRAEFLVALLEFRIHEVPCGEM